MAVIEGFSSRRSTEVRRAVESVPPQAVRPEQAGSNAARRLQTDGFDTGAPRAATFTGTTAPRCPVPLQGDDLESAQEAIALAHDSRSAEPVVEWLREHPAQRDAFMQTWSQYGSVMGETLNDAQYLGDADKRVLSNALGSAYRSGAITDAHLENMVTTSGRGSLPGETHEGLGEIVGMTHNPDLISRYAEAELEAMKFEDGSEPQRATAIAEALSGLSPSALQDFLAAHPDDAGEIVQNASAHMDAEYSDALGNLLETASRIQPPTEESLRVFSDAVPVLGENEASRAGAAEFFRRNGDAVLESLQDASGSLTNDGAKQMSEFFARTLFTEPQFEGQERFRQDVMSRLQSMTSDLNAHATDRAPPDDVQRQARLMGSLTGALEGGFQVAIDELEQRNESVDGMVDLLFSAKDLIPDLPIPGAGKLKDLTLDQIQDWVKDSLHEDAQSAAEAIPFHVTFGETIGSPYLRTLYDAARGTTFDNRAAGL